MIYFAQCSSWNYRYERLKTKKQKKTYLNEIYIQAAVILHFSPIILKIQIQW